LKQLFKKIPKTRYIKYSEANDEPAEHYEAKIRIHSIMGRFGYFMIANTDKHEFALPPIKTELDGTKNYTIDALMYNAKLKRLVAVEINGAYHFSNKVRIGKTKQKHEEITRYLFQNKRIVCDGIAYDYVLVRTHGYKTEEIIGKNSLSDDQLMSDLC